MVKARRRKARSLTVKAGPTKAFFVDMLTRDIDLADAILDLLDNCLDGVLRNQGSPGKNPQPFEGYWARINISPDAFEIVDNCGGIPRKIAEKSAFMLGRPDPTLDADLETIGMYGIGMKRAIFKMGRACTVTSEPDKESPYEVTIAPVWFQSEDDWELPLRNVSASLGESGTRIRITRLLETIRVQFDETRSSFIGDLRREISTLFALIIQKGFTVFVNDAPVEPAELALLAPHTQPSRRNAKIAPYAFKGTVNGVHIDLCVGFSRPLASPAELDLEAQFKRSKDQAGWTVVCNDRVVLYADTTSKTGWGTATVPNFHNQFIAISGIVGFRSSTSMLLPLNTTKRGIDMSSPSYLYVLDIMREGTKLFTDFTNKWKGREEETSSDFAQMVLKRPLEIIAGIPKAEWADVRKGGPKIRAQKFMPNLPLPEKSEDSNDRIVFSRPRTQVRKVSKHLFDDPDVRPSDVGARCFDETLEETRK